MITNRQCDSGRGFNSNCPGDMRMFLHPNHQSSVNVKFACSVHNWWYRQNNYREISEEDFLMLEIHTT